MIINIDYDLKGSILDIGGGGEAIIGQMYGDKVTAIDNRQEELDEAPNCCTKLLMNAEKLSFFDGSFDNVTFFYTLMYMSEEIQRKAIFEATRVLKTGGIMCIWDCTISSAYPEPFAMASVIWEIDSWSLAKQSGIYFAIACVIMFPISYFANWMPHSTAGILSYVGIFVAIFLAAWVTQYSVWKRKIQKMNEGIKDNNDMN